MDMNRLTPEAIAAYALYLRSEERAPGTIEKYLRDVRSFAAWLEERTVEELTLTLRGVRTYSPVRSL